MPEVLTIERREHACVITLQRPAKLNAISAEMERELCEALRAPEVRDAPCVIFTGGERVFSAGADLNETWGLDPGAIMASYRATGDFAERVADLPQPTLSAISGYCLGGGFELALATDFRIAEPSAIVRTPGGGPGDPPQLGRDPPPGAPARPRPGQGADPAARAHRRAQRAPHRPGHRGGARTARRWSGRWATHSGWRRCRRWRSASPAR